MSEPATKADLQDLKDGITAEIKELTKSINKRFDNMDERFNNQGKRFDKIETKLDTMDNRLDTMENRLTDHIERNFNTVVQFAKKSDKGKKQNQSIESRLKLNAKDIGKLKEDVEILKNR